MIKKISESDRVHYYISPSDFALIKKTLLANGTSVRQMCKNENISYTQMSAVLNGKASVGRKYCFIIKKYTGIRLK